MHSARRQGRPVHWLLLLIRSLLLLALEDLGDGNMHVRHHGLGPAVGELADQSTPGDGDGAESDRHAPFLAVQTSNLEGFPADEDDEDLAANHDGVDGPEEIIARDTFENIELVVETPVIEFVEDLEPDKGVKDEGAVTFGFRGVRHVVAEQGAAAKVEAESNG